MKEFLRYSKSCVFSRVYEKIVFLIHKKNQEEINKKENFDEKMSKQVANGETIVLLLRSQQSSPP
jgi:hypothetical protein